MDDLAASFVNEANELLEGLEEALLKLENNPEDQEQVNRAFRVMTLTQRYGCHVWL